MIDALDTPQAHPTCFATLSSSERQRADSFIFERHRRQYVFAHGLLRIALSSSVPEVEPSDWRFVANRYGRPFIAAPAIARPVYFSLAHTAGCVACVVSGCEAVGVDVEEIQQRSSMLATAYNNFSQEEFDALRVLQPGALVDRFFDYWTLKEAYLKARGIGISLPLNQFSILISSEQKIGIQFMAGAADDAHRWNFMTTSPSVRHRLAVADGSGLASGLPIIVRGWPVLNVVSGRRDFFNTSEDEHS
jgi:4'-phosphopantetheinyl transferase